MRSLLLLGFVAVSMVAGCAQIFGLDDVEVNHDARNEDAPDAASSLDAASSFIVDHLGEVDPGLLQGAIVISNSTLVSGLALVPAVQTVGGGAINVLYFDTLVVKSLLTIDSNKPVLLVGNQITITSGGSISAGASGINAFAGGGSFSASGAGGGGKGIKFVGVADSGGGGGGFGTFGAAGGTSNFSKGTGAAGVTNGTAQLFVLTGGSAGGDAACEMEPARGGAGGGAVQLSAKLSIVLDGSITASGGGGSAGQLCSLIGYDGGAGGGSGGAIFIQTPFLIMNGGSGLYANGGGGGAGSQNASPFFGTAGQDGLLNTSAAIGGVAANAQIDRNGGAGGTQASLPSTGGNGNNGGGGGGAVGRIVIHGPIPVSTFSPAPVAYN